MHTDLADEPADDLDPRLRPHVAVVGSANLDLVVHAHRVPEAGETVLGDAYEEHAGGKGLNQALGAAGQAPTAFVGTVGADRAAERLLRALESGGVDVTHVRRAPRASGVALVQLVDGGENHITVVPGANVALGAAEVTAALGALRPAVLLTQLESPLDAVVATADWARTHGARWVLNPSPVGLLTESADAHALRARLADADPLIVNAGEARAITGAWAGTPVAQLGTELAARVRSVVVTDGPRGAVVAQGATLVEVPAIRVTAVDTTGAGDCFAGTLAGRLARGDTLVEAAHAATAAASHIVALARGERG